MDFPLSWFELLLLQGMEEGFYVSAQFHMCYAALKEPHSLSRPVIV